MNALNTPTRVTLFIASTLLLTVGMNSGKAFAQFPQNGGRRYTEPLGRGAFLHHAVYSTDELLSAVRNDAVLRQRYAKHFGVSQARVLDFMQNSLIAYRLPADRVVTNYGVTSNGRIFGTRTRLKKGTMVWANRSGLPVLKWACANPLTKNLPGTKLAARPRSSKPKRVARTTPEPLDVATSAELEPQMEDIYGPSLLTPPLFGTETSALIAPELMGGGSAFFPAIAGVPGGGGGLGPGILVGLLPFFIGRGNGSDNGGEGDGVVVIPGGGGGGTVIVTEPEPPGGGGGGTNPPTITIPGGTAEAPEPGTLALLAAGLPLGMLAIARRRRRA
jgi:hypothetical protein